MWKSISSLVRRVRKALGLLRVDTIDDRNRRYDEQTLLVMQRVLRRQSNTIDVGCHEGSVLREMLRRSPRGIHYAFEPLPEFAQGLRASFGTKTNVRLHEVALSDVTGSATFQHVVTNPGYSGLRQRRYDRPDETLAEIVVRTERLDDVVPRDQAIDFVKIDVEGAELLVLRGAVMTLRRTRPTIVFEHGPGAADFYGARPEQVYDLLSSECGLRVFVMADWLQRGDAAALDRETFAQHFDQGLDYYYMACP
jgi:FkbM family methyltransferase